MSNIEQIRQTAAKLRAIVAAVKRRGNPDTAPPRAAVRAYGLGHSAALDSSDKNDAKIYRSALWGLGQMHRKSPPTFIRDAGYDMTEAWSSLTNERRGEAIMVCLAAVGEADDPGAPPRWMREFDVLDEEGCAF
jgi:hypothetical protein